METFYSFFKSGLTARHTVTLSKHSGDPSVTTPSSSVLSKCHDVIPSFFYFHCQLLRLIDLFFPSLRTEQLTTSKQWRVSIGSRVCCVSQFKRSNWDLNWEQILNFLVWWQEVQKFDLSWSTWHHLNQPVSSGGQSTFAQIGCKIWIWPANLAGTAPQHITDFYMCESGQRKTRPAIKPVQETDERCNPRKQNTPSTWTAAKQSRITIKEAEDTKSSLSVWKSSFTAVKCVTWQPVFMSFFSKPDRHFSNCLQNDNAEV